MSIFDNLDALRLSPHDAATAGTREILTHVPVRKPNRTRFFRVHPDPNMALATGVFEDKEEREVFLVAPSMREELAGEMKLVRLVTCIERQGVVFLWPVPLPDESGRRNTWSETAREAAQLAQTTWIRMASDSQLGAYRISTPQDQLSDPVWPDKTLKQLLEIGFKGQVIDSLDHPVVKRLRGLT